MWSCVEYADEGGRDVMTYRPPFVRRVDWHSGIDGE